jgi:hypothetical protein
MSYTSLNGMRQAMRRAFASTKVNQSLPKEEVHMHGTEWHAKDSTPTLPPLQPQQLLPLNLLLLQNLTVLSPML